MNEKHNIPKHWQKTTLGKILTISSGNGLSKSKRNDEGEYLVYGGNGITGKHSEFLFEEERLIIGRVGVHCGNAYLTKPKSWVTDNAFVVSFDETTISKNFLLNLIGVLRLNKYSVSTAQPVISQGKLYPIEVALPPLPEQHAIVSKIEELFSELENGKQQLQTALQQLKVYRQSLLKWAFEGKLTNKNVKDGELPEGWRITKLGEVLEKIEAGKSFKCDERTPQLNEVGVLKVSAVTWQVFNENESKTVIGKDKVNENYFVQKDDFLFSRANTLDLIGAAVIVHSIDKKLMISDKTLRFIFNRDVLKPYVLYYLRSRKGRREIQRLSTGNQESMRNIGQERIKQIEIPIASLSEQQLIVQQLESKLTVCDKIEETITQSLQQAETLRQSILKKAFEGKLVPSVDFVNETQPA